MPRFSNEQSKLGHYRKLEASNRAKDVRSIEQPSAILAV